MITQQDFEVLIAYEKANDAGLSISELSNRLEYPGVSVIVSDTEERVQNLAGLGLLIKLDTAKHRITEAGLSVLEPYRVQKAIILAAGFGSRMVPVTLTTPKPLVCVQGRRLIDGLLEAIEAAGIPEVIVVRGYKAEQFDELRKRWPKIRFIENEAYDQANNISSVWLAREELANAYVCEADLLLSNPHLIRKYEYTSNYLGVKTDKTDDWCFKAKDGMITEILTSGENVFHMYGISYWNEADALHLSDCLDQAWKSEGGKQLYWDEVALRLNIDSFQVQVRPCTFSDIIEIDTFEELCELDETFLPLG